MVFLHQKEHMQAHNVSSSLSIWTNDTDDPHANQSEEKVNDTMLAQWHDPSTRKKWPGDACKWMNMKRVEYIYDVWEHKSYSMGQDLWA